MKKNYTYLELDDDAIQQYREGGWVIEEVPTFPMGGVISKHGWDYKKEGDNYLTKRSGNTDWITASGDAKSAIQERVNFGDTQNIQQPSTPESTSLNTEPPVQNITQSEFRGRPSIAELQQGLADNDYYLGPKGVDGFDGTFTQGALAAQKQGISATEYNKRFESQELETLPGVTVPSTVFENATTGSTATRPVSARPSAAAERSLNTNVYEGDYGWQSGTPEDIKYYHKDDKYLGDDFSSSPVIDISDEIYSHADDFIIDYTHDGNKKTKKQLDMSSEMKQINKDAGSCLRGALNCNQKMVANKAGANSIRGLMAQMETQLASNTRYSIPSHGGNVGVKKTGDYKHTMGYDAWELGDALVGEGLAQDLYKIEPDHKDFNTSQYKKMTTDFKENYVDKGVIPVGAIVFQGNSKRSDYTDPKYGNRSSHGTTVVGFDKEGLPLIYDNGKLKPITEPLLSINRVVIPKGYENYTFTNLKQGKKQHVENLGYNLDEVGDPVKYEDNPEFKPYVNKIYKGINKVKGKIGVDYNIESDVMDKLSKRVVGIGGKETNFGNYGDEDVSSLRQLAIETESGLTSTLAKPLMKGLQNWMNMSEAIAQSAMPKDKIKPDWKIEMMAYNTVNGNMDLFPNEYKRLRREYQKPVVLDDAGYGSSSVGVFAMKKLPAYAKDELGLTKGKLYGADVADDKEFSRGAQASLVHMVESYTELKRRFKEKFKLTDDELVDLATVAYNSGGKAYDEDFIKFYIKDKKMPDNYLTKTKKLEQKYGLSGQEKELAIQKANALEQAKKAKQRMKLMSALEKNNQEGIAAYRPPALPNAQAESTGTNMIPEAYRSNTLLKRINPSMDKLRQGMLASATNAQVSRKQGGVVYKELTQDEIDQYKMGGWIIEDVE